MFRFVFFICCFICYNAQAEEVFSTDEAFNSSLTNTESLVSTLIDGTVSAITGEWVDTQMDLSLISPEPFEWRRFYSSHQQNGNLIVLAFYRFQL